MVITMKGQRVLNELKNELEKLIVEPINNHNESTKEHSTYQRKFAQKILILIRNLEDKKD